ncbi:sialate O-acetylesterase [Flavobacterium aquidurense]|jgi:sialate O-acetylesterase|uniref:GDSL-type esterase/lipase family protein n=1 Tax=Flavobacterium aquidurense TaxID=362413 RepID=UPI000922BC08|nr:GDSL-type esterase/lipase family protein [Flavobacterium aquidurense]OXA73950.1 sialate O-acetylesterase [Flavobacterium aquidurense]SHH19266.1 sialate O-acetylesterase [Flavobacterium frigidimaris]
MRTKNRNIFIIMLFISTVLNLEMMAQTPIKIACIGDSVTAGYLLAHPQTESYPSQLQILMGSQYEIKNFGHSGATLLKKGSTPYFKTEKSAEAIAYRPDIAIIHLGLNDTDPRNWPNYREDFDADYAWLIDTLKTQNPKVKIFICRMTPIFNEHPRFKSGTRDWFWQIQEHIQEIAKANHVQLIDLHEKLDNRPDLFPDALHPTKEGAAILAQTVYSNITQDFGGLKLSPVFTDNMVLQRNQPIVIYGTANGGEKVAITFNNHKEVATTNEYGKWKAIFPAMKSGGAHQITIALKEKNIVLKNIMIGDVWFCSGQSNMAFPLQKSENGRTEVKKAINNTSLRLFNFEAIAETDEKAWDSITLEKTNRLAFFSGKWKISDSISAKDFSAIAYYFGQNITREENVPIGLIQVAVGGSPIESWIDRYTLEHDDKVVDELTNWRKSDFIMPWVRSRTDENLKNAKNPKQRHPYGPSYNYEAGVTHFTDFPIKGIIWYQGESNAHNIELYEHLMPVLVGSWRKAWGTSLPFYYVQLSGTDRPTWPSFRDAQNKLQKIIPNSSMAISSDYGDSTNVHPIRKKQIGDRLALLALKYTYGKNSAANGPSAQKATQKGDAIIVSFSNAKQLSTAHNKDLIGFELVTEKGIRIESKATIIKNEVSINIPKGEKIKTVLYAWKPYTTANLVNEANLPCSTFQLDLDRER